MSKIDDDVYDDIDVYTELRKVTKERNLYRVLFYLILITVIFLFLN